MDTQRRQSDPRSEELSPEELLDDAYLLDAFLEFSPDHAYFKDRKSRFLRISKALAEWLGLEDPLEAIGKSDFDFYSEEHARKARVDELQLMRTGKPLIAAEERETWADGHESWVSTTKVPLRARSGSVIGLFGISRDITERKRAERELARQASELALQARALERLSLGDELTGLLNRRGFLTLGRPLLEQARKTGRAITLLYVDVDGLKRINDEHGHACGDLALRKAAELLRATTRRADVVARLGGDEFCVLLVDEGTVGERVSKRIQAAAQGKKRHRDDPPFELSLSVGLARQELGDSDSLEQLLERADSLMYENRKQLRAGGRDA